MIKFKVDIIILKVHVLIMQKCIQSKKQFGKTKAKEKFHLCFLQDGGCQLRLFEMSLFISNTFPSNDILVTWNL